MAEPLSGRPAPRPASSEALPVAAAREFLNGLKRPCRLLVAYSGGGDSTGLLVALAAATKGERDVSLIAATVDHRLRPGSTDEAHAAGRLCEILGIPHHVLTWQGEKPQSGIQAAAREARYGLLGDLARETGAGAIVTAHTRDDQAETMAMRRMRNPAAGAGISEAVLLDRRLWVLRPFLGVGRGEIRDYLLAQDVGWVDDPSNENEIFERVRVRKALSLGDDVWGTPLCLAGHRGVPQAQVLLSYDIADFLIATATLHSALVAVVDLAACSPQNSAHLAAIRHLAAMLGGRTHAAGRETGARIAQFLATPDAKRLTAERVVFDKRRRQLYLTRERRSLPEMVIDPHSTAVWDNRFRIRNTGNTPVRIGVRGEEQGEPLLPLSLPQNLPPGIRQRALAAEPVLLSGSPQNLTLEPVIAQFDRFLPLRLLLVANALAFLLGLDHFPGLPTR
jgi:tRNA(Ile)-lysidine synthase